MNPIFFLNRILWSKFKEAGISDEYINRVMALAKLYEELIKGIQSFT